MHYVILDMEWDSVYHPIHKRFINQILQIGAVKLDENFNVIDIFDIIIKSSVSKKVSKRFVQLTGITKEMMLSGVKLSDAVNKYNEWLGENTVTITWSQSDLYTIIENQKYLLKDTKFKIDKYLDLQKYIQGEMAILGNECKSQISLCNAAEILGITTENYELHNAKDDSLLCAALLKEHYCKERFDRYIKDTKNPEFFKRLCFKPYFINDINDPCVSKQSLDFYCQICGGKMKQLTKWRFRNNSFTANFICKACNKKFICRISFKKTFDNLIVKRRILEPNIKKTEESANVVQPVSTKM
ncbi:MAG: exonuclease domain-containing protein [Acutalibacteraceae bacterium]